MIKIITDLTGTAKKEVTLDEKMIYQLSGNILEMILSGLPEEAQTVETVEYVITEIKQRLKEHKMVSPFSELCTQ